MLRYCNSDMMHRVQAQLSDDLIDAASRAFARHGYQGATLERIAEEAGVSRVTLHRRHISKASVLEALAERATAGYREALWPALTATGTARERLEQALVALCTAAEEYMPLLLALRSQSDGIFHGTGEDDGAMTRTVFTEPLERLLRDGAADGSLRPIDPAEGATVLFNLVGWTYIHLREGHGWPAGRARGSVLDIALNGVIV